jgi:hypothetical protein
MVETMHGKAVVMSVATSKMPEAVSGKTVESAVVKSMAEGGPEAAPETTAAEAAARTAAAARCGIDLGEDDDE